MKTLVNCTPREFLRQTGRIKKSAEKWLTLTEIGKIRQRKPVYETVEKGASAEERKAVIERNAEKEREQAAKNISAILDAILEDHPDETLELLSLCCFIEPEDIDNHTTKEYLRAAVEIINDPDVLSFFTSLMQLVQTNTPSASKA